MNLYPTVKLHRPDVFGGYPENALSLYNAINGTDYKKWKAGKEN